MAGWDASANGLERGMGRIRKCRYFPGNPGPRTEHKKHYRTLGRGRNTAFSGFRIPACRHAIHGIHKAATGGRAPAVFATTGRGFMICSPGSCCKANRTRRIMAAAARPFGLLGTHVVAKTLGFHVVVSGYGLWLPGDGRGHWSEAWDADLGLIEPHQLHPGDPVRLRIARERTKHASVRLDRSMAAAVAGAIGRCAAASDWTAEAAAIEATHTHLLLTYSTRDIGATIKWLKDQSTKAVHAETAHQGPVWCKGNWCTFVFDHAAWKNARTYIERHNVRRGLGPRPYDFLA